MLNKTANQILNIIAEISDLLRSLENNFKIYLFLDYETITHTLNFCTPPNKPFPSSLCLCFKTCPLVRNLSDKNQFFSQIHSNANQTHFHKKGFAVGLCFETDAEGNKEMACQCCLVELTIAELQDTIVMGPPIQVISDVFANLRLNHLFVLCLDMLGTSCE